jgi:hypothetical protein
MALKIVLNQGEVYGMPINILRWANFIKDSARMLKVHVNTSCPNDNIILLTDVVPQGPFISSRQNKVPLKPGDKRIESLGRDHLNTDRLTKHQFDSMVSAILDLFTDLGVSCDIVDEITGAAWRNGLVNNKDNIKSPKNFPVEK